jgi:hypothetical protein
MGTWRGPDDAAADRFLAEHGMVSSFAGDELVIEAGSEALLPAWPPEVARMEGQGTEHDICAVCQTPVARHSEAGWRHEVGLAERGGCTTPWPS